VLGTGSADRWPNPWCTCRSCTWARLAGRSRARTSALVDGRLLIDPGPDAGAGGADLSAVRTVLVTHDHPDHLDPSFLLAWSWAGGQPLVVAGPEQALARCRDWVATDAPVRFHALAAGDEMVLDAGPDPEELGVRVLPAAHSTSGGNDHDGTALIYEVTGPGARMLYATDTAALPHEQLAGPYDLVLLELTFGGRTDHGTAHLDLRSFGQEVAQLRADGQLALGSRVIAVHLSHHNPTDVAERLAAIGAEVVDDGTTLAVGPGADPGAGNGPPPVHPCRRLLVTGGARSGKSRHAESVVAARPAVTYVATAPRHPDDPEWVDRVAAHRHRRPADWTLQETTDLPAVLGQAQPGATVLVDCLTLWVTAIVDDAHAWATPPAAVAAVQKATAGLIRALGHCPADVVLVTNEVGSGIVPATASARLFRDLLGEANAAVAAACDDVALVTSGIAQTLKGQPWPTTST
jgi:adenosylcobinamide kinase/adenosylcobinamide-phosphate guanylyltransferase